MNLQSFKIYRVKTLELHMGVATMALGKQDQILPLGHTIFRIADCRWSGWVVTLSFHL